MGRRKSRRAHSGVGLGAAFDDDPRAKLAEVGNEFIKDQLRRPSVGRDWVSITPRPRDCVPIRRSNNCVCLVHAAILHHLKPEGATILPRPLLSLCGEEVMVVLGNAAGQPITCLGCLAASK